MFALGQKATSSSFNTHDRNWRIPEKGAQVSGAWDS